MLIEKLGALGFAVAKAAGLAAPALPALSLRRGTGPAASSGDIPDAEVATMAVAGGHASRILASAETPLDRVCALHARAASELGAVEAAMDQLRAELAGAVIEPPLPR